MIETLKWRNVLALIDTVVTLYLNDGFSRKNSVGVWFTQVAFSKRISVVWTAFQFQFRPVTHPPLTVWCYLNDFHAESLLHNLKIQNIILDEKRDDNANQINRFFYFLLVTTGLRKIIMCLAITIQQSDWGAFADYGKTWLLGFKFSSYTRKTENVLWI